MRTWVISLVVLFALCLAQADVNLEWRLEGGPYKVGDTARVGLYAVADPPEINEPFSVAEVLVFWDPQVLALKGIHDNGPYPWMFSGFPDDSGLDGLNNTFEDGNADYQAWANMNGFPVATPQGLLMTTFKFEARAANPAAKIEIRDKYGKYSVTAVYDEQYGGWNIVNKLGSITVPIGGGFRKGDLNCDGAVNNFDIDPFTLALTDPAGYAKQFPNCDRMLADVNGDGEVNNFDIDPFVKLLTP